MKQITVIIVLFFIAAPAMAHLPVDLSSADVRIMKGDSFSWRDPAFNDADWKKTELPSNWDIGYVSRIQGNLLVQNPVSMSGGIQGKGPIAVCLGKIRDNDEAYLNNIRIGGTGKIGVPNAHAADRNRIYELPPRTLREGENILALRIESPTF